MERWAWQPGPVGIAERVVLLLGNVDSTGYSHSRGPYIFPDYAHRVPGRDDIYLCRKPTCSKCAASAEAATLHTDCVEYIEQRCILPLVLDHLWIVTAWHFPWREAPNFCLEGSAVTADLEMFHGIGMSRMTTLPPEVFQMVYRYSATSLFWRYSAASELTRQLSSFSKLLSIPLDIITTWNRGSQPVVTKGAQKWPVIRLTVDSWGIRTIERLSDHPRFKNWRTDNLVFIILDQSCCKDMLHFRTLVSPGLLLNA